MIGITEILSVLSILLIVLFFWYLATELDSAKRKAGACFIIGLASFCLISLFVNGMRYGIDIEGGEELTLRVQPKLDDEGNPTVAPTEAPTAEPTEAPTEAPTEEPTEAPAVAVE